MSTIARRPLSLLHLDFRELFARHLCRHSQFGINVAHLAALFGTWYAAYALVYWWCRVEWVPVALAGAYLAVLAPNIPVRVLAATGVFLACFVAAVILIPELPFWVYLVMIPVFYKLQSWSHRVWTVSRDMTEFDRVYPKGFPLFVVLL